MDVAARTGGRDQTLPAAAGWVSCAAVLALAVYALAVSPGDPYIWAGAASALFGAVFAALLLTVSARSPLAWLFFVIGLTRGVAAAAQAWSTDALVTHPDVREGRSRPGSSCGRRRSASRWRR
jgi:hypothetical protein